MVLIVSLIIFFVCLAGLCSDHEDKEYTSALRHYDLMCTIEDSLDKLPSPSAHRTETRETERKMAKDENGREVWLEHTKEKVEVD